MRPIHCAPVLDIPILPHQAGSVLAVTLHSNTLQTCPSHPLPSRPFRTLHLHTSPASALLYFSYMAVQSSPLLPILTSSFHGFSSHNSPFQACHWAPILGCPEPSQPLHTYPPNPAIWIQSATFPYAPVLGIPVLSCLFDTIRSCALQIHPFHSCHNKPRPSCTLPS